MTRPVKPRRFRLLGERFTVLIIGSLLLSLVLYVISAGVVGVAQSIISGLASALFALGIVTYTSEYVLKSAFTEDILDITELKHEIYNVGIQQIILEGNVSWPNFLASTREVTIVTLRPSRWHATMWPSVLHLAARRQVQVSVIFIAPSSQSSALMAQRLGLTPEIYAEEVKRIARTIEDEWKREKVDWPANGSTLEIQQVDVVSMHSLVRVDGGACLIAEPVLTSAGSQATLCFIFRDIEGRSVAEKWLAGGLQDIRSRCGVPVWTDVP